MRKNGEREKSSHRELGNGGHLCLSRGCRSSDVGGVLGVVLNELVLSREYGCGLRRRHEGTVQFEEERERL